MSWGRREKNLFLNSPWSKELRTPRLLLSLQLRSRFTFAFPLEEINFYLTADFGQRVGGMKRKERTAPCKSVAQDPSGFSSSESFL